MKMNNIPRLNSALRVACNSFNIRNSFCNRKFNWIDQRHVSSDTTQYWNKFRFSSKHMKLSVPFAVRSVEQMLDFVSSNYPSSPPSKDFIQAVGEIDVGVAVFSQVAFSSLIVPIVSGRLQMKDLAHAGDLNLSGYSYSIDVLLCRFGDRATRIAFGTANVAAESPRAYDPELAALLQKSMIECGVELTESDLLHSEKYQGTIMARVYRAFVFPREGRIVKDVYALAKTHAEQIKYALREYNAAQASYLQNSDTPDYKVQSNPHGDRRLVLVLDNLRSALNVGSLFRTGEAAGVAEIVTAGITPHPPHNIQLQKTALGSDRKLPTRHFEDIVTALKRLKEEGYKIFVMETTTNSISYSSLNYKQHDKIAVVLGNEVTGVDTKVMESEKLFDSILRINSFGSKNSLNVANAGSIMLFEVIRQWHS